MPKLTLSAFADEISPDLTEQLNVLESESIRYLCLRGVWGKNVTDLTDAELLRVKRDLTARGFGVSSIGSPIGKIKVSDPFAPHLDRFRRALVAAKVLEAPYVRIFSFYGEDKRPPLAQRDEVIARLRAVVNETEGTGVTLIHENESDIYGEQPEQCLDLIQAVSSPLLKAAFDPANFVQRGVRPFDSAYKLLKDQTAYLHIKDARIEGGTVVPFGEGDGQGRECLQAFKAQGFTGFATLEPHLKSGGQFSGFSGPDLFRTASRALKKVLDEIGYEYD